ncbi:MAG: hypothetical protein IJA34_11525 [Lachnospiraceae bacterium]|nr:hypothetical protein [Lachnospiraceae bacterium]
MSELVLGKTANEVWKKAVDLILKECKLSKSRLGDVYEILHTFITIEDPRQKWIYARKPPLSIGYALAELVWMLNGEDRADVINFWNPNLSRFAGNGSLYYGAYGKRIRHHFGFDQLEKTYYALQNVPESRQVVIQIYDSKVDFPIENGKPRDEDIPCNVCSMLKVREGKLEWSQIMRSNDVLLGMPYDFVLFTSLQEILAGWLGLEVGSYNHYSDSLHLYNYDVNKIGIGQEVKVENIDSLSISKNESERILKEIYNRMEKLAKNFVSKIEVYYLANLDSQYVEYNNIMLIIAIYVAHKMQYYDLVEELLDKCTNNVYVRMWKSWSEK